jgi:hypothetical protein
MPLLVAICEFINFERDKFTDQKKRSDLLDSMFNIGGSMFDVHLLFAARR